MQFVVQSKIKGGENKMPISIISKRAKLAKYNEIVTTILDRCKQSCRGLRLYNIKGTKMVRVSIVFLLKSTKDNNI